MAQKLTIEEVKNRTTKLGLWEIFDDHYINCETKLNCICIAKGHLHQVSWDNIKQNKGCPYCTRGRLNIDIVKERAKKLGKWQILDNVYVDVSTKLNCRCLQCGREHKISWSQISQNQGCPYCFVNSKSTMEKIKKCAAEIGIWTVLDDEYVVGRKLNCMCIKGGHYHQINWNRLQQGDGCTYCYSNKKLTIEEVKKRSLELGVWEILDAHYENSRTKLMCRCIEGGHIHELSWAFIQQEKGCPFCSGVGSSSFERKIQRFFVDLNFEVISNDRTQLINPTTDRPLELDVWFPKIRKAIECNGIYWHGMSTKKNNDKIKQRLCKQQGIDLLAITDEEWNKDIDKCKLKILRFIGKEV